jgi:tetratricopeptide (TPR) repeat protein
VSSIYKRGRELIFYSGFLILFIFSSSAFSQDTTNCSDQLDNAENEYQMGKWDDAVNLIKECLKKDISESERGRAYRILGLVYIAIQLEKEANEAVKNLLMMVPNYKIDPDKDPPQLKSLLEDQSKILTPLITSISPGSADQDGDNFTLTVKGSDFVYGSVIRFNNKDKNTIYIDTSELKAEITSEDLSKDGDLEVYVYSPILDGKSSNIEKFNVKTKSAFPWTWIAVGAGAVVVAVVAVLTLGGSDDGNDPAKPTIADPPARP